MTEIDDRTKLAQQLSKLLANATLEERDRNLVEQCQKRLANPLRLLAFGTDSKHAISILNLLIGQMVIPPSKNRVHAHFSFSEQPFAVCQFRDGAQKRLSVEEFNKIFDDNPVRIKIGINLPALKKTSMLVITNEDSTRLADEISKSVNVADIVFWAGGELTEPLVNVWSRTSESTRARSYLALSPQMDATEWVSIQDDFVDTLTIDPRLAQHAKDRPGSVDKAAFRAAGGTALIKAAKNAITSAFQGSIDAAEVFLLRHAVEDPAPAEKADLSTEDAVATSEPAPEPAQAPSDSEEPVQEATVHELPLRPRSVVSTKARSTPGSKQLKSEKVGSRPITQQPAKKPERRVSKPVNPNRPVSKAKSKKQRPAATPWSLGL